MNLLHLFAPSTAVVILTLLTACAPKGYQPAASPAERASARHYIETETQGRTFYFRGDQNDVLAGRRYPAVGSPRHVVVAFHGLSITSSSFAPLARELASHGFELWCPDRRGLGLNRGGYFPAGDIADWKIWTSDAAAAVQHVRDQRPGVPLHVLGVSMGAAIAVHYAGGTAGPPVPRLQSVQLIVPPLVFAPLGGPVGFVAALQAALQPFGSWPTDPAKYIKHPDAVGYQGSDPAGIQYLKTRKENDDVLRAATNRGFHESFQLMRAAAGRVDDIAVPLHAILAGKDKLVNSVETKKLLERKARHLQDIPRIQPDEGHMIALEQTRLVGEWLRQGMLAAEKRANLPRK
jgi:acylglycerol lipase